MANGQTFDMHNPCIDASNWWPLGTRLKVIHSENEKQLTVTVTDRGPFKHALDLSWAAFQRLDRPSRGIISVRIQVLDVSEPEDYRPQAKP